MKRLSDDDFMFYMGVILACVMTVLVTIILTWD